MTCSEVERVLPDLLDGAPDGVLSTDFENHVKSCSACSDLVSDLKLIASEARDLSASEEPAPRVWVRIAAQLREEGIIRDAESHPVLVPVTPRRRWSSTAWWLAPVAASLLAAGAYVVNHKPVPQVAHRVPAPPVTAPLPENSSTITAGNSMKPAAVASATRPMPATQPSARGSAKPPEVVASAAKPAVEPDSAEDQQFLSVVSTRAPSMRATYEDQLQKVNANIREVQDYLVRYPADADARQQLLDAYQQKALLYQIALDRIQ